MNEDIYRSQFRLPYSLYEELKASADANGRSINAELVAALQSHYRGTPFGMPQALDQVVQHLEQRKDVQAEITITVTAKPIDK